MKRNTDLISKNDLEKKRSNTSTPKNPSKKLKNDDADMKAKRQIDFKSKDQDESSNNKTQAPVSYFKPQYVLPNH